MGGMVWRNVAVAPECTDMLPAATAPASCPVQISYLPHWLASLTPGHSPMPLSDPSFMSSPGQPMQGILAGHFKNNSLTKTFSSSNDECENLRPAFSWQIQTTGTLNSTK